MILYTIVQDLFSLIFRLFFRSRIMGLENIPAQGGIIIACNHLSLWDPPFIGAAVPRDVHFMAKAELFQIPVFGWLIRKLLAFPVKRGTADRTAIKTAVDLVKKGHVLGLFPEGTRSKSGELGSIQPGISLIAYKSEAIIIPAIVENTNKIFSKDSWFPQIAITFGPPVTADMSLGDKEAISKLSSDIMQGISDLLHKVNK